jgi:multiple sugar transport system ATP-binding protein
MSSVTFEHVTKRFGEARAVSDLSLQICDKEFLVLVGPSGSGKSTALRLLAGLDEITEGDIRIGKRVVTGLPPKDRNIAMVFQTYALYPHMTVYDNMAFGLHMQKTPQNEIDTQVKDAAAMLGISEFLQRKPKTLSGGQRQRVAVGRAIVRHPAVFLFDEPLSNLDAKLRVQMRAEIIKLQKELETTFVYVTHDQVEAMTMAHRIAVLRDGLLQQVDTPENLYDRPANVFVAGFMGSPAMNFFDARLARDSGQLYADMGIFRVPVPPGHGAKLAASQDGVIVGIRPEDIYDAAFLPPEIAPLLLQGKVEVAELSGSDIFLHMQTGGQKYVARVDRRSKARVGATAALAIDLEHLHLFDKQSELAIVDFRTG